MNVRVGFEFVPRGEKPTTDLTAMRFAAVVQTHLKVKVKVQTHLKVNTHLEINLRKLTEKLFYKYSQFGCFDSHQL